MRDAHTEQGEKRSRSGEGELREKERKGGGGIVRHVASGEREERQKDKVDTRDTSSPVSRHLCERVLPASR